ncbi:MAG: hypothetical protein IJ493_04510 [Clostridia bacterium]|nr:hypothetical protein [Clostridia bacterium]
MPKNEENECEKICAFCRFASEIAGAEEMLCERRGVVGREYRCRRFVYDPLKRVPRRPPALIVPDLLADDE